MVIYFRDKSVVAVLLLLVLCLAVHLHIFFTPIQISIADDDGLLSIGLKEYASRLIPNVLSAIYIFVILLQAIWLNWVLNELRMFTKSAFTTAMAYVFFTGILSEWCSLSATLITNFFLIGIFIQLSRLYNAPNPKTLLFNIGNLVGISVLFFHPSSVVVAIVFFALMVVRPFRMNEWVVLLMGIILPYYLLISGLYIYDKMDLMQRFTPELSLIIPFKGQSVWFWVNMLMMLVLVIISFFIWLPNNNRMLIHIRKNWGVMIVLLLILLPVPFVFKHAGINYTLLSIVPMAAFVSNLFLYPKRMLLPNFIFILIIIIIAHNNWVLLVK